MWASGSIVCLAPVSELELWARPRNEFDNQKPETKTSWVSDVSLEIWYWWYAKQCEVILDGAKEHMCATCLSVGL